MGQFMDWGDHGEPLDDPEYLSYGHDPDPEKDCGCRPGEYCTQCRPDLYDGLASLEEDCGCGGTVPPVTLQSQAEQYLDNRSFSPRDVLEAKLRQLAVDHRILERALYVDTGPQFKTYDALLDGLTYVEQEIFNTLDAWEQL